MCVLRLIDRAAGWALGRLIGDTSGVEEYIADRVEEERCRQRECGMSARYDAEQKSNLRREYERPYTRRPQRAPHEGWYR